MSGSVNLVVLVGHLGRDPEIKYTASGTAVVNFSVATTETWKDRSGDKQKKTTWHRVVAWDKLAETVSKYTVKGSLVYVEGKLDKRDYQTRDGEKKQSVEVIAHAVRFLSKSEGSRKPDEAGPATDDDPITDEDIPI